MRPLNMLMKTCALKGTTAVVLLATIPGMAFGGPEGGVVNSGQGTVEQLGTLTRVSQETQRLDLTWQQFDIAPGDHLQFVQPGPSAIALNRIESARPSQIAGQITANGQVWLQNPHGIVFAPGAEINVGGLLATSSQISRQDFLNGNYAFATAGGAISQQGNVAAGDGGVVLVSPVLANTGSVETSGNLAMHAGSAFAVDLEGDGLMSIIVEAGSPIATSLTNSGRLASTGGFVYLSASDQFALQSSLLKVGGTVEATGITERDGAIYLTGASDLEISGELTATRASRGGEIIGTGQIVSVQDGGSLNVSAPGGGGKIDLGGRTTERPTRALEVEAGGVLAADATGDGDGGRIELWSEELTDFRGLASARADGVGDGGFIEIAGARGLRYSGEVALGSRNGALGTLLFDPLRITILPDDPTDDVGRRTDDALISQDVGTILRDDEGLDSAGDQFVTLSESSVEAIDADIIFEASDGILIAAPLEFEDQNVTFSSSTVSITEPVVLEGTGDLTIIADADFAAQDNGQDPNAGGVLVPIISDGIGNLDSSGINILDDVQIANGNVTLRTGEIVQIGSLVFRETGEFPDVQNITGNLSVNGGDVRIEGIEPGSEGPDLVALFSDVTVTPNGDGLGGNLDVMDAGSIFVEATNEQQADRVSFQSTGLFLQAPLDPGPGPAPVLITIIGNGTNPGTATVPGDGVFIEAADVIVNGTIRSAGDISIRSSAGDVSVTEASGGAIPILDPIVLGTQVAMTDSLGQPIEQGRLDAAGQISLNSAATLEIGNPIDASDVQLTATDFNITDSVSASAARVRFQSSGSVGALLLSDSSPRIDRSELNRLAVSDLTFEAVGSLTIDEFNRGRNTLSTDRVTFTASEEILIQGFVSGRGSNDVGFVLSFGEQDGVRPESLRLAASSGGPISMEGRIGVESLGDEGIAVSRSAPNELNFFVDGNVELDPEVDNGSFILASDGAVTIDITGDFLQLNTAAPGPISFQSDASQQLQDGIGGAGADLAALRLENASRVEIFGSIGGQVEAAAAAAVVLADGVTSTEIQQVNDCPIAATNCGAVLTEGPPMTDRMSDPEGPRDFLPDVDDMLGRFDDLALNSPFVLDVRPVTNRGDDEEWLD